MAEIKKDCNWYRQVPRPGCVALTELQCKKKEKCSFYETKTDFCKRQKEFEKLHGGAKKKRCRRCKELKPITEFSGMSASADGLDYTCRECNRQIAIEYRQRKGRKQ